jgi:hypothetical protein
VHLAWASETAGTDSAAQTTATFIDVRSIEISSPESTIR